MSTELPTAGSNSSEDMTTSTSRRHSGTVVPFMADSNIVGVLGVVKILSNLLVLLGLYSAGRSKMNVSSAYIVNHTTIEQYSFSSTFKPVISDFRSVHWRSDIGLYECMLDNLSTRMYTTTNLSNVGVFSLCCHCLSHIRPLNYLPA